MQWIRHFPIFVQLGAGEAKLNVNLSVFLVC